MKISVYGSSELKKGLQNVAYNVCLQRRRENYSTDFHKNDYKDVNWVSIHVHVDAREGWVSMSFVFTSISLTNKYKTYNTIPS